MDSAVAAQFTFDYNIHEGRGIFYLGPLKNAKRRPENYLHSYITEFL